MTVKYPIDLNRVIKYSGIMDPDAIQQIALDYFANREYDRYDNANKFISTQKGRVIEITTVYEKQYSDDDIFEVKFKAHFADVVPITITVDGKKKKMYKGRVKISFTTFMKVNATSNWSGSPIKALFQYISAFHIFKHHLDNFRADAKRDIDQLYDMYMHLLDGSNN